jgi:ElaB/YqjD/DUF883 family membrane-anchored ribosome-binding protein
MEPRKTARTARTRNDAGTGASIDDVIGEFGATSATRNSSSDAQGAQASGLVGKVKERATAQLSTQKDRATDHLGSIVQAVRHSGERLREDRHETVAQYVEQAAEQLERFSNSLREKDVNELLQDAQRLARRQPALFIGGSFAAGLLAARFLKSSQERDSAYDEYRAQGNY